VTKLAVSIPSYKRPELLIRNLQSLAPQCIANGVEIHIFDDSCSDVNQWVYDQTATKWPCLTVHKNPKNLGIDRNIDQCISIPCADYVWMIGEDDLASDEAIREILERLEMQPEYLFVNYQYISNDYEKLLHIAVPEARNGTLPAGEFFRDKGWAVGFLGANVVNKQRWDANTQKFIGTYFSHVGKIFSALNPNSQISVIARPIVFNRAESLDSFTWIDDCFEVNAGFGRMIEILSVDHQEWTADAKECLNKFMAIMNIRDLKSILVLRALGVYNWQKYKMYMRGLPSSIIYAVVALAPVSLMKTLYKPYRLLKHKRIART
jgi:glycosyltransferase involved in cell wall biosynthesis